MVEENFEKDIEIISNGDICDKLYFIVQGQVSIEIIKKNGECWEVDVLQEGDVIGL